MNIALQIASKWASRFGLCMTLSVPICRVNQQAEWRVPDIVSAAAESSPKPPDHQVMTDGCGYMNLALAQRIQSVMGLDEVPSAVQMRLNGAKGMLVRHPYNQSGECSVGIRPSQRKIALPSPDLSQQILELVRVPMFKTSVILSSEILLCLDNGGVPQTVIEDLFELGLRSEILPLSLTDDISREKIWDLLDSKAAATKLRRQRPDFSRALGLVSPHATDIFSMDESTSEHSFSIAQDFDMTQDDDPYSGFPIRREEAIKSFLDSGFDPERCPQLRKMIRQINDMIIKSYKEKCRVKAPFSFEGFAIPDPYAIDDASMGVLRPGQIYCRSSRPWINANGDKQYTVLGPVLVTRHPCKFASDVQKFEAVDCGTLMGFTDIVIFSCQGSRSPLSIMGGGDYDGDTVVVISQPEIVNGFEQASRHALDPPADFVNKNFIKEKAPVPHRGTSMFLDERESDRTVQRILLSSLRRLPLVGAYSNMHELAVYRHGYTHPAAERLAHMFSATMDDVKSGLRVLPDVLRADQNEWSQWQRPAWKRGSTQSTGAFATNPNELEKQPLPRSPEASSRTFILERMYQKATATATAIRKEFDEADEQIYKPLWRDAHLIEPHRDALKRSDQMADPVKVLFLQELRAIEDVIRETRKRYLNEVEEKLKLKLYSTERRATVLLLSSSVRNSLSKLSSVYISSMEGTIIAASYAYLHDLDEWNETRHSPHCEGTLFPWELFFRELREIKAKALGLHNTIIPSSYKSFKMNSKLLKYQQLMSNPLQ
ncbi:RNA dependent RNA polymerase-domain-containing protein [Cantharellus anzutake]|uniref:RNA dependent RNA polymerase-domain-containing protein n=1 Tax=Cantharellus anzutake TaxID=1750568 RepID=UPI001904A17C|nr:RNA dependent RNA polymerase-domain-containing protein [Cantharellus anzutake]KAF8335959.1 RNA dependent RNA polymerase-domain-containing protein [Cantharellus anzutake]